jgi:class 3 adenylate cyclase
MSKQKILIIDDEVDIAKLVVEILTDEGYDAQAVHTGEEGLKKVKELMPDLILLDWQLPDIEGPDICRMVKSSEETSSIPVIMLTSLGSEDNKMKGFETGADDYVTKPFSSGELLARIKVRLRRAPKKDKIDKSQIEQLQKYLPKEMIERILSGSGPKSSAGGEKRFVTMLLADISGFTSMSEQMDAEKVRGLINECFKSLVEVIYENGGTIDKFMGDAILALFGAPVAHEDDQERALLSALSMQRKLEEFNKSKGEKLPKPFKMRIGVNSGSVVAGTVGSDMRMEYTVMGDAVNVTARLQTAAQPGQIFISRETHDFVKGKFEFTPLDPITVKGKKEPVGVFILNGQSKVKKMFNEIEPGKTTQFVGRKREYGFLKAAVDRLPASEQGCVMSAFGEYGIGKSRIAYELLKYIFTKDVWCMQSWFRTYGKNFFCYDYTNKVFVQDDKIVSHVSGLCKQKPGVIILDDLDDANEQGLKIIEELFSIVPNNKVLIFCLHRADFTVSVASKPFFRQIEMPPLTEDESRLMVNSIVGEKVQNEAKTVMMQKAEGIPLYLEEVIKALIHTGVLKKVNSEWVVEGKIDSIDTPPKIQCIIMARFDRLSERAKRVLQYASVIGQEFKFKVLKYLIKNEDELKSDINTLRKTSILAEKSMTTQRTYCFKHSITREVVFNTVLNEQSEEIKKKIDKYMETESMVL